MQIINPATGKIIEECQEDTEDTAKEKYNRVKEGQKKWEQAPLEERINIIKVFSELLDENKVNLAETLTKEVGKPIKQSVNEINAAQQRIAFFIENSPKWLIQQVQNNGPVSEIHEYEPLEVIGNISAWNYPYLVGVNVFIPALIAGNAVLYKPSEYATLTGLQIEDLLHQSGVPKNAFCSLIGNGRVGELLLNLPLDGYFFTGSVKTGKHIAQSVAQKLVPIGLELGGKDSLYVTDAIDDFEKTAISCVDGCFYNNGQSCCAVERIYVHEKIYDQFLKHFISQAQQLKVGDPFEEDTNQGPLTRPMQRQQLNDQLRDAVEKGAMIVTGGLVEKGNFFPPTVLVNVDHTMKLMTEESFGPIIGIQKVMDDEEAVQLMNDTEYGLTASVYTNDQDRAKKILQKLDVGTGYVNCCDRVSPFLPWSGRRSSGMGTTLSYLGILAFVKPKAYHLSNIH